MKKFFIGMLAVLMVSGAVYAAAPDMDFSGMINTRGRYVSNDTGVQEDAYDYMFYDMEFDADLAIRPTDKTGIFLNFEIHDENFNSKPNDSQSKTGDDNIVFKRAWGKYNFTDAWSTSFGLMTGAAFGTSFADSGNGRYRVRVDGVTGIGKVGVVLEKNEDAGAQYDSTIDPKFDAESDDSDGYYAYWVGKFGDITPMVLVGYVTNGTLGAPDYDAVELGPTNNEPEGSDLDLMFIDAAVTGNMGMLGFEGEFVYQNFAYQFSGPDDYSLMGVYGNVWANLDAFKVGAFVAYGSWDKDADKGFYFGDDFYPGLGVGEFQWFGSDAVYTFSAVTMANVYVDFAVNEKLSTNANISFWSSNEKDTIWEDGTGYELTVSGAYKLADNVTYDAGLAYGSFDLDDLDVEPYTALHHRIKISF